MAKIGEGHAEAMLRLGLKELRNAANPSPQSVADSEMGLYLTATQGEIAQARSDQPLTLDQMRADAGPDPGQERGLERGIER
jgi:hypothetical protein